MSQLSNQADLPTDIYAMGSSASIPIKSGLNTKKMLGISAATLLLGGSAWAISQKIVGRKDHTPTDGTTSTDVPPAATLPDDIDVSGKTADSMTFEEAFETARNEVGIGGVFSWHGHWYNTFEKEEWSSLSLAQRQEFTEMITQEHLPVKLYEQPNAPEIASQPAASPDPTIIEGHLNGQRIMGLDFDQDGVIDTLVMEGADGCTYRVVDASGDDGLDTLFRYDSLSGELVELEKIDEPFVLSNDQFIQGLEASMSKDIVDSILEPEASSLDQSTPIDDSTADDSAHHHSNHLADSYEFDDTYVNDGDVQDMDE